MSRSFYTLFVMLLFPAIANATILFQDNFDDGNTDGWSFSGINPGPWSAASGEMQSASSQTSHMPSAPAGGPGAALIDSIVTPDHFSLEADIRVIGTVPGQSADWGHVGFVWGWSDRTSFNTSYLRTHRDHVTSFGKPGGSERLLGTPGTVNNTPYHMKVEVDYIAQVMSLTLDAYTTTFTGADFQAININSGASIGLITWGERVGYDNVVLRDLSQAAVPLPATLALFGIGLAGMGWARKRTG